MSYALIGAVLLGALAVLLLFVYASSIVSENIFEGDSHDHELALSLSRARARVADGAGPALPQVLALLAPIEGPRDPVIGIDVARAEVRERIHRYNSREVKL